jgi:hypothetical protein
VATENLGNTKFVLATLHRAENTNGSNGHLLGCFLDDSL